MAPRNPLHKHINTYKLPATLSLSPSLLDPYNVTNDRTERNGESGFKERKIIQQQRCKILRLIKDVTKAAHRPVKARQESAETQMFWGLLTHPSLVRKKEQRGISEAQNLSQAAPGGFIAYLLFDGERNIPKKDPLWVHFFAPLRLAECGSLGPSCCLLAEQLLWLSDGHAET